MNKQVVHRKAAGLYSSYNPHEVPEGALVEAENVVIERENVISKCRGFSRYGDQLSNPPSQLLQYKDTVFVHDGTTLKYDSDGAGTWSALTGSFSAPASGHRIRSTEARRSLYFTESNYPYRLDSVSGTPRRAGVTPGFITSVRTTVSPTRGWLTPAYYIGYRVVFATKDTNGRIIFGEPSPPYIEVAGGVSIASYATVHVLPDRNTSVSASDWYYLYRTPMSSTAAGVGEVYYEVSSGQVDSGSTTIVVNDYAAEDFITPGPELYSNATREGLAQSATRPPHAKDIATYKGYTFYANYRQPHRAVIRCVEDGLFAADDTITVTRGSDTQTYTAKLLTSDYDEWYLYTLGSAAVNVEIMMKSLAKGLAGTYCTASFATPWYGHYTSANDIEAPPGEVTITAGDCSTTPFTVTAGSSTVGEAFSPNIYNSGSGVTSVQDSAQNGLCYSKFEEPDAVPLGNVEYVGSEDSEILRILPLRNSLIILKEEGVWRLTGQTEADFIIEELDPTVRIDAPETAVVLNNAVFCSSNQGVVRIDEATGVSIVSRPIEHDLRAIQAYTDYATIAHAAAYESDRQYWLFVPENSDDTYATIAYIYNYITGAWTVRRKDCGAAMVLHDNRKLYLGHAVDSYVLEERKSLSGVADFVDELISTTVSDHQNTTDSDGNTVTQVTCTFSYTPHDMSKGWLFKYGDEEAIVVSYTDNEDGTYTLVLSDQVTLPNLGSSSTHVGFFDLLSLVFGGLSVSSGAVTVPASLGIPIISTVTWAEEGAGNPSSLKQFGGFQLDFDRNYAWKHELAFSSNFIGDRNHGTTFEFKTPGWGTGGWADSPWDSNEVPASPIYTPLPTDQQFANWVQPTYKHYGAKETFDIIDMSLTFRQIGHRGVRKP